MRYDGKERRRYPRSRRGFAAIEDKSGPGVLNHVDNISANGVLCHTVKPIPVMTIMGIVLELPESSGQRIEGEGVVVRCDADELGDDNFKVAILFTKLSDDSRTAIEEFVAEDLAAEAESE